jgi:hypothetical protein
VTGNRPPTDTPDQHEVVLPGGIANRGKVVRIGDSVHRPQRTTSPATHALLQHLEMVGFAGAPRFLGVDAHDREILSYIPGSPVLPPYPDWALSEDALVSVAQLLHAYHRAVADFDPAGYTWPTTPPPPLAGELVSHNDPNVDNIIFRDGRAVALIDFDLASPGSRLWDVACAARLWAPLRPTAYIIDNRRGREFERLRTFVDSYGLNRAEKAQLLSAVVKNQAWFYQLVAGHIAAGHTAFLQYTKAPTRMPPREYARWLSDNEPVATRALDV